MGELHVYDGIKPLFRKTLSKKRGERENAKEIF